MIKKIYITTLIVIHTLMATAQNKVIVYPAPAGETLNQEYTVEVERNKVDVYPVKVAAGDAKRRFKAVDDLMHSSDYFDYAAFCYFAVQRAVTVNLSVLQMINSAKILPSSYHIRPLISGKKLSFVIRPGENITVEINGDIIHSLHIFADPIDQYPPSKTDTNVIYFGPGIHEITSIVVRDNKTVYVAGGAILKAVIGKNEEFSTEPSGLRNYPPTFILAGSNIKFRGPGIIDASACPTHSRNLLIAYRSRQVSIEGVILINSSSWTVPIVQSDNVVIKNIKIIGYRANSDGIDINNSSNITVDNCFVRTNDDLIVIKTFEHQPPAHNITVQNCVLWNQLADALSIGGEVRENVSDVLFSKCDIIHDTGREWSLRIFQCDSSKIDHIKFEDINIEESHQLVSLWIGKAGPSYNKSFGYITHVIFRNINVNGSPPIEIIGGNSDHQVSGVEFDDMKIKHKRLSANDINKNNFVTDITIRPISK